MKKIYEMRKNHRCIVVPLRVPVCTLTEVLWHIDYRDPDMRLPQGLWTPRCRLRSHILVSQKGELNILRMSNLIRFKVGFADHRAHPDGITGLPASLGTVCQSSFCSEQAGVEPAPPREKH